MTDSLFKSEATTRCQGTASMAAQPESGASGLLRIACPTARADPGEPACRAISPYVLTRPGGIERTNAKTFN